MNVTIYAPFAIWPYHFETDLEIARNHIEKGDTVTILQCQSNLGICEPNKDHEWERCLWCKSRYKQGIKWLGAGNVISRKFYNLTNEQRSKVNELVNANYKSVEDVLNLTIGGADIGLAAASSAISHMRESELNLAKHKKLLQKYIRVASEVYFSISNYIEDESPDLLVLVNGRVAALRPALRVAQKAGIRVKVHERAGVMGKFSITDNTYPHDLFAVKKNIARINEVSVDTLEDQKKIGVNWFRDRMEGYSQGWHSFTRTQEKGLLPEGFNKNRLNVVIFNNSEDEFAAIREWHRGLEDGQNEWIEKILNILSSDSSCGIYLRVHPNLSNIQNTQISKIREMSEQYPNLTVIPPESRVSTYELIKTAGLIITFGSTVGVEAAYMGVPSILLGRAQYEDLNVCIKPSSSEELRMIINQIRDGKININKSQQQREAIKYAYYQATFGKTFKFVKQSDVNKVVMVDEKGEIAIQPPYYIRKIFNLASDLRRWCKRKKAV